MTLYYEGELPSEEILERIRTASGAPAREWLIGNRDDEGIALVEGAFNLLGVLAGLNRRDFSTFQFKTMRRYLAAMPISQTAVPTVWSVCSHSRPSRLPTRSRRSSATW